MIKFIKSLIRKYKEHIEYKKLVEQIKKEDPFIYK
jgi:hypothetical protein